MYSNYNKEIVSTRIFPFPANKVFSAWSNPEKLQLWWGPHGFKNTFHQFTFLEGGKWDFTMHGPRDDHYKNEVIFKKIVTNKLIVLEHLSNPYFNIHASFENLGDRTKLVFRMIFKDEQTCDAVKKVAIDGNEQNFDRLESLLQENHHLEWLNPELDLVLSRFVELPPHLLWKAWTTPDLLKKWFCPKPWTVSQCEIELKKGGAFRTTMLSPEGQEHPNNGCFLELIENKKIVWTDTLSKNYRPISQIESGAGLFFTATILFEPHLHGTQYTAIALHKNSEDRKTHEQMGFHEGWGIALDQLIDVMRSTQ